MQLNGCGLSEDPLARCFQSNQKHTTWILKLSSHWICLGRAACLATFSSTAYWNPFLPSQGCVAHYRIVWQGGQLEEHTKVTLFPNLTTHLWSYQTPNKSNMVLLSSQVFRVTPIFIIPHTLRKRVQGRPATTPAPERNRWALAALLWELASCPKCKVLFH